MSGSLRVRVTVVGTLVLGFALAIIATALDRAFEQSAESAQRDYLKGQLYGLLAASEVSGRTLDMPENLPEAGFSTPASGLFGAVQDAEGRQLWQSQSAVGVDLSPVGLRQPGDWSFERRERNDTGIFLVSLVVAWELENSEEWPLVYSVAESETRFQAQIAAYRRTLFAWLAIAGIALIGVQVVFLGWGLAPLDALTREVRAVEQGHQTDIQGTYPREVSRLTRRLNHLIRRERTNRERYRNSMDDLAHSLKTPLAVLRAASDAGGDAHTLKSTVSDQVDRMQGIVDRQLGRTAAPGKVVGDQSEVKDSVDRVVASLERVYQDKTVNVNVDVSDELIFLGDTVDLYEIVGNILDNAFKHCRANVTLSAKRTVGASENRLELVVEDDGAGFEPELIPLVSKRGVRGDEKSAGQGLGLALVADIVHGYGGDLRIENRAGEGARVTVSLPSR